MEVLNDTVMDNLTTTTEQQQPLKQPKTTPIPVDTNSVTQRLQKELMALMVVLAVQGRVPVLFDGGIRRGTDVFKALALGAQAVLVGRPVVFGLAAKGEYGARRVIEMLKDELELTMALSGCPTLNDITRNHVRMQSDNRHCRM